MSSDVQTKMQVACPHCEKQLRVPASAAGKAAACPACKQRFSIPQAGPSAAVGPTAAAPAPPRPSALKPRAAAAASPLEAAPPPPRNSAAVGPVAQAPPAPFDAPATTAAAPSSTPFDFAAQDNSPSMRARRSAAEEGGGASYGKKNQTPVGMIMTGVLMMVGAVIWFGVGLAAGYIIFYPPVLFVFGIVSVVMGIGKAASGGGRTRRY